VLFAAGSKSPATARRQGKLERFSLQTKRTILGTARDQKRGKVMADQSDSMVQSIIDRNRKEAKKAEEKATVIGAVIAVGGFQLVTALGIVHFPPSSGINLYRLIGAALCGALGGAIGKWIGRPRSGKQG
jgi:hypothetical protein